MQENEPFHRLPIADELEEIDEICTVLRIRASRGRAERDEEYGEE